MEIAIIGTGAVGSALARGFARADHSVVLGSRRPERNEVGTIPVLDHASAIDRGVVVVLAVPPDAAIQLADEHADALDGIPVVDTTNEYPHPMADRSIAERIATAAPKAQVVKAFNTIGAELMTDPAIGGVTPTMFLAGDNPGAVSTTAVLARDLGFEPIESGDLAASRHLEALARLWIHLSHHYGREIGFRLLQGRG